MKWPVVRHVFIKDGRDLLRDRRTIFVNVVLPVLLYPLLAIIGTQLMQLAKAGPEDWPKIGLVDVSTELRAQLPIVPDTDPGPEALAAAQKQGGPMLAPPLPDDIQEQLRDIVSPLTALTPAASDASDEEKAAHNERSNNLRSEILPQTAALLREHERALVVMSLAAPADARSAALPNKERYLVLLDGANPRHAAARSIVSDAMDRWRKQRVRDALQQANISIELLTPFEQQFEETAAKSETIRSRLAGIIPILLVLLALSGAFYPAIDLIAGERERGTLETLLSWPGGRHEIFAGKLLVVFVASLLTVMLNLASLGLTFGIVSSASPDAQFADGLVLGIGTLLLCGLVLLPLTITLAAVALGLAGLAASTKEAQNYLGPLFLLVLPPALIGLSPNLSTSCAMDLIPIVGPVLVLKQALQSPEIPWSHLIFTSVASSALAYVVVSWCARLLDSERFLFPGLVKAGWGRFRTWGKGPSVPDGLEVIGLFAICVAGFAASGLFIAGAPAPVLVIAPLALGLALPVLLHNFLGAYSARETLFFKLPSGKFWLVTLLLIPLVVMLSNGLGALQQPYIPPESFEELTLIENVIRSIHEIGGLPLLFIAIAITPGVCEELLCRGTLLSGLRKSLGSGGAVLVSSLLFAVLHMNPWRFIPQFTLGVILAILTLRSGSLVPAMVVHAGHNGTIVALYDPSAEASGDESGTGGEVFVIASIILALVGCALLLWPRKACSNAQAA